MVPKDLKIYLKGKVHGIYGSGAVIHARRSEEPSVEMGKNYTIEEVVEGELGACSRNLKIRLEEVDGQYSRNTFIMTRECYALTMEKNVR